MWIFGYGSLVWKTEFPYTKKVIGFIKGYERKFWQASIDHRGIPEKPGRVVTIIPCDDPEAQVWGVAYEIIDLESISKLKEREKRYIEMEVNFYPNPHTTMTTPFCLNLYIGPVDSLLGHLPEKEIAIQIHQAKGPSGTNSDYLHKLCHFMRESLPHVQDNHLYTIENELLKLQKNS